ncbi:MAG TPA: hypothetical protein VJA19_12200 [Pseudomonas sp.]|nr:hypothetical protein [Pseudomonas sp.]
MTFNLARKTGEERNAIEAEKARLFELRQQNIGRAKASAAKLFSERSKRKGKWEVWLRAELETLTPPEYASMVRSEVRRLVAGN